MVKKRMAFGQNLTVQGYMSGHEQTPILAVFDINGPNAINPKSVADISLGGVNMPNGQFLQSKKSIDVVYDHIIIGK